MKFSPMWTSILIAAGIVLVLLQLTDMQIRESLEAKPSAIAGDVLPDTQLVNFRSTDYDENGKASFALSGKTMTSYTDKDHVVIEQPFAVIQSDSGQQPWHVRADQAITKEANKDTVFSGNVSIWRDDGAKTGLRLNTAEIAVSPERKFAETPKPVTILSGKSRSEAVGAKVDLEKKRLILQSRVKETHETR